MSRLNEYEIKKFLLENFDGEKFNFSPDSGIDVSYENNRFSIKIDGVVCAGGHIKEYDDGKHADLIVAPDIRFLNDDKYLAYAINENPNREFYIQTASLSPATIDDAKHELAAMINGDEKFPPFIMASQSISDPNVTYYAIKLPSPPPWETIPYPIAAVKSIHGTNEHHIAVTPIIESVMDVFHGEPFNLPSGTEPLKILDEQLKDVEKFADFFTAGFKNYEIMPLATEKTNKESSKDLPPNLTRMAVKDFLQENMKNGNCVLPEGCGLTATPIKPNEYLISISGTSSIVGAVHTTQDMPYPTVVVAPDVSFKNNPDYRAASENCFQAQRYSTAKHLHGEMFRRINHKAEGQLEAFLNGKAELSPFVSVYSDMANPNRVFFTVEVNGEDKVVAGAINISNPSATPEWSVRMADDYENTLLAAGGYHHDEIPSELTTMTQILSQLDEVNNNSFPDRTVLDVMNSPNNSNETHDDINRYSQDAIGD